MGSFELTPQKDESYYARLTQPKNTTKTYRLPAVQNQGTVLNITNTPTGDSLEISLTASPEIQKTNNRFFLIGQSRGVICFAKTVHFKETTMKNRLSKTIFPGGITCFTLMNSAHQPLNERIVYIKHNEVEKKSKIKLFLYPALIQIFRWIKISEVSYAVGFTDSKYFSKAFRQQYGKTPSEYMVHIQD